MLQDVARSEILYDLNGDLVWLCTMCKTFQNYAVVNCRMTMDKRTAFCSRGEQLGAPPLGQAGHKGRVSREWRWSLLATALMLRLVWWLGLDASVFSPKSFLSIDWQSTLFVRLRNADSTDIQNIISPDLVCFDQSYLRILPARLWQNLRCSCYMSVIAVALHTYFWSAAPRVGASKFRQNLERFISYH